MPSTILDGLDDKGGVGGWHRHGRSPIVPVKVEAKRNGACPSRRRYSAASVQSPSARARSLTGLLELL